MSTALPPGFTMGCSPNWMIAMNMAEMKRLSREQVPKVPLGQIEVPARFTAEIRTIAGGVGEPWWVALYMSVDSEYGTVRIDGGFASGLELEAALRSLTKMRPLEWWKKRALMRLVEAMAFASSFDHGGPNDEELPRLWADLNQISAMRLSGRRNQVTREMLEEVAAVYTNAAKNPTAAVHEHFGPHISYRTAARYVSLAKDAGLITR